MDSLYDIFIADYAWLNSLAVLALCSIASYVAYVLVYDRPDI